MIALPYPADREEWRDIADSPGYQVSTQGRVRSFWTGGRRPRIGDVAKILSNSPHSAGYCYVTIKAKPTYVHRLMLLTFVGEPPEGKWHCRHLNGNPTDNRLDNLAWGTPKENQADLDRHGRRKRGEDASWSRYTDAQVQEAVRLHRLGKVGSEIEELTGIRADYVSVIVNGGAWTHVTGIAEPEGRGIYKITVDDARSIVQMVNAGMGHKEVARLHGTCTSNVSMIVGGHTWTEETADIRRPVKKRTRRQLATA